MNENSKNTTSVINKHENSGRYFSVEGLRTFALDHGSGEAVVCIHGVPTSSFLYRKVLMALKEKGHRGISIDLPGLGLSARPEDFDYTFSGFAAFLARATRVLGVEKFHLVVHDIGGPIGFAMAGLHPEKILSLSILNTWIDVVRFRKPWVMRPFAKKGLGELELKAVTHASWPVMFRKMGVLDPGLVSLEEINAYVDLLKREDQGKAFLKIMRSFEDSSDFRELCYRGVQEVPYPVQAVWGSRDPALTYDRYGLEIKKVAGLEQVTRLEARHFLQEEAWSSLADKIDELILSTGADQQGP